MWVPEVLGGRKVSLIKTQNPKGLLKLCYLDMPFLQTVSEFPAYEISFSFLRTDFISN